MKTLFLCFFCAFYSSTLSSQTKIFQCNEYGQKNYYPSMMIKGGKVFEYNAMGQFISIRPTYFVVQNKIFRTNQYGQKEFRPYMILKEGKIFDCDEWGKENVYPRANLIGKNLYLCNEWGSNLPFPSIIFDQQKIHICDEWGNKSFYPSLIIEGSISKAELYFVLDRSSLY